MHLRRIAAFVLGAWIVGSLFMAYITAQNSHSVEAVFQRAPLEVSKTVQAVGAAQVALLLRYQTAEQNRRLSRAWGLAQLVMGLMLEKRQKRIFFATPWLRFWKFYCLALEFPNAKDYLYPLPE